MADLPSTPSIEPTLDELLRSLDHAETEYTCADFIDDTKRRTEEREFWRRRRDDLRAQIAEAKGRAS